MPEPEITGPEIAGPGAEGIQVQTGAATPNGLYKRSRHN